MTFTLHMKSRERDRHGDGNGETYIHTYIGTDGDEARQRTETDRERADDKREKRQDLPQNMTTHTYPRAHEHTVDLRSSLNWSRDLVIVWFF